MLPEGEQEGGRARGRVGGWAGGRESRSRAGGRVGGWEGVREKKNTHEHIHRD